MTEHLEDYFAHPRGVWITIEALATKLRLSLKLTAWPDYIIGARVMVTETNTRDIFMVGFAYGCRYGYEGIYHGRMKDDEIRRSMILSGCLFDETEGIVEPTE